MPPDSRRPAVAEAPAPPPPPIPLQLGTHQPGSLAAGAVHAYLLDLEEDEYIEAIAQQDGVDLALDVIGPSGERLLRVDSPSGRSGPERLVLLAIPSGRYLLELVSLEGYQEGDYTLTLTARRPAGPADRRRAEAALLFATAEEERRQRTRESRERALSGYDAALAIYRGLGERAPVAEVHSRISMTLSALGRREESVTARRRSAKLYAALGDRAGQARATTELARELEKLRRPTEAQAAFEEALGLFRGDGDVGGEAEVLNALAGLAKDRGAWKAAERLYGEAAARDQRLGDRRGQAVTLINLGGLYLAAGEDQLALDVYARAASLLPTGADPADLAALEDHTATAYRNLERYPEALAAYQRALALRRRIGDVRGEAYTLDGLAQVRYYRGDYEAAEPLYRLALQRFAESGDRRGEVTTLQNLAWLYGKQGRAEEALALFRRALPRIREAGERRSEAAALLGMARVERQRGRPQAAWERASEALAIIETLRAGTDRLDLRTAFLAAKQDYFDVAIGALMELHAADRDGGHAAQAFAVSERSRARTLLDILPAAWAQGHRHSPRERRRLRQLQERVNAAEENRLLSLVEGASEAERSREERELRAALGALRRLQARLGPGDGASPATAAPPAVGLAEVKAALLDDGALLLEYDLGSEGSTLWAVSREGVTTHALPPAAEIEALAEEVHRLLAASDRSLAGNRPRRAAEELSVMLLGRVAERLAGQPLLIVPDGALHYIPFGALPLPRPQGGFGEDLLARHRVAYAPSASVAVWLAGRVAERSPPGKRVAVLADPVFGLDDPRFLEASLPPPAPAAATTVTSRVRGAAGLAAEPLGRLRYAAAEARAILGLVPPEARLEALGFAATKELALSGALAGARIVHFATHGLLDREHPELSGLALSTLDPDGRPRDGILRLHEIYELELAADLVVLSACRTALGRKVRGEGLVGLAHGFFQAGAGAVVVSLWPVDDEASAELMKELYRGLLLQGLPPAEALRGAQLALRAVPRWSAPYYWAGFVLQGGG